MAPSMKVRIEEVPLHGGISDDGGSYVVIGERLPMLVLAKDEATASAAAEKAARLTLEYLLTHYSAPEVLSYLGRRGLEFSVENMSTIPFVQTGKALESRLAPMPLRSRIECAMPTLLVGV